MRTYEVCINSSVADPFYPDLDPAFFGWLSIPIWIRIRILDPDPDMDPECGSGSRIRTWVLIQIWIRIMPAICRYPVEICKASKIDADIWTSAYLYIYQIAGEWEKRCQQDAALCSRQQVQGSLPATRTRWFSLLFLIIYSNYTSAVHYMLWMIEYDKTVCVPVTSSSWMRN